MFRVAEGSVGEPLLVTKVSLPGDVRSFTPAVDQCLERGERYAWSVAAASVPDRLAWAPPLLFQVQAAPAADELEQALATIQRHLDSKRSIEAEPEASGTDRASAPAARSQAVGASGTGRRDAAPRVGRVLPEGGALTSPTVGGRVASAGTAPTLGAASLTVSSQVHLGAASAVFKDDELFLWDDSSGNTALGREALAAADSNTDGNTAVGKLALHNAASGFQTPEGSFNTAVGSDALYANTTGYQNSALGAKALFANTTGYWNVASGYGALRYNTEGRRNTANGTYAMKLNQSGFDNTAAGRSAMFSNTTGSENTAVGALAMTFSNGSENTALGAWALRANSSGDSNVGVGFRALYNNSTGDFNSALGFKSGYSTTGSSNISIHNGGSQGESNVLRIGQSTPAPDDEEPFPPQSLNKAFIHGIRGKTVGGDAVAVMIDSNSQLGTVLSSRRFKQDVSDPGAFADRLLELRPVAFRYRQQAELDPETPLQFGLIAEEVAEVFPELVVFDEHGKPETVKYHLLSSLLLRELQRQNDRIEELEARLPPPEPRR